jgi:light-regulated signal transduction histidine kinase (bacteriophytochrome)
MLVRSRTLAERARKDLEEVNRELEGANRELEAFSYSVSHDLRAPLRSIEGFSQILLEDYADKLDEEGEDYLGRVRAASRHMATLIDDLLDLSRVTRGPLRRELVDLGALATSIVEELRRSQPDREVEFVTEEGVVASADANLVAVALENLIGNAWKFTSRKPRARIEFGSIARQGEGLTYFVRDDGAGFDEAYAGKLFGAFQRLHAPEEFEGTGIGLATVQRIIHRHGGRVWAEGEVGGGATFYFTLGDGHRRGSSAARKAGTS